MRIRLGAWTQTSEDGEIAAANRAAMSSDRRVADTAFQLQSARSRNNPTEVSAAEAQFRQAWESNVRMKGGNPTDFIPGYPNYQPLPVIGPYWGGWDAKPGNLRGIRTMRPSRL